MVSTPVIYECMYYYSVKCHIRERKTELAELADHRSGTGSGKHHAAMREMTLNLLTAYKVRCCSSEKQFTPVVVSQNRNNWNTGEPSGNWCLGPSTGDASARVRGYHPRKNFEIVYEKFCNLVHFCRCIFRNADPCVLTSILKHFNNGNGVRTRSPSKWHTLYVLHSLETNLQSAALMTHSDVTTLQPHMW